MRAIPRRVKILGICILTVLVLVVLGLAAASCWVPPTGDWQLVLSGTASEPGSVGYKVSRDSLTVEVGANETASQIGPRLASTIMQAGLAVECEVLDGGSYYFIVRNVREPHEILGPLGIGLGHSGPLQSDAMLIEVVVTWFYENLNDNNAHGIASHTTAEFRQDALDAMASMAQSGEQLYIQSIEDLAVDCYDATVRLNLIREVGEERQPVVAELSLVRPLTDSWLVSGGAIP